MTTPLITASGISKIYKVYSRPSRRLLEMVTGKSFHRPFAALSDISFEIHKGQSFGLIGENGAGKSTLLKILSGVTRPSQGRLEVRGKVASLLELGMGFHPEFSGRQNIRLNAAMLGLSEEQVERQTPEIIAFSELGPFIDRPVKTYSTGMVMRLGFSIAVQVEPEILIIDEALSVGDGYFQKKCMDRIRDFLATGRTLVFCSHAMYYLSAFCQSALWIRQGKAAALGPVTEVVKEYESYLLAKGRAEAPSLSDERVSRSQIDVQEHPARLQKVRLLGGSEDPRSKFKARTPWSLEIQWHSQDPKLSFHLAVGVDRLDGVQVCAFSSHRDGGSPWQGRNRYRVILEVPELPLIKGDFSVYIFLLDQEGLHVYDTNIMQEAFEMEQEGYEVGLIRAEHGWVSARA